VFDCVRNDALASACRKTGPGNFRQRMHVFDTKPLLHEPC